MLTLFNDTDLFNSGELREKKFDIPDADLTLYEHFFNRGESDRIYKTLLDETPWKQEPITVYAKTHLTPRLTTWYGKNRYGNQILSLTPTLESIRARVEEAAGVQFTSVLLNLYRDGQDGVAWHRDNEREYGNNPIGSVSFGETRPFQIRHKFRKELERITI